MTSLTIFDDKVHYYITERFHNSQTTILDIGAGRGKYYNLFCACYTNIDAVEIHWQTIVDYQLCDRYRSVYHIDVTEFEYHSYDVIIMGDVLEHMSVDDAQRVLAYALDHCREIIVVVPFEWPQPASDDNPHEEHLQPDLTCDMMYERYPELRLYSYSEHIGFYVRR